MLSKGFGGAERHFVDLSIEIAARGNFVQAICHTDSSAAAALRGIENLCVEEVMALGTWDRLAAWRISRLLRSYLPDIVHTHLARGAALATPATRERGLPLLANMHNYVNLKYYRNVDKFIVPTDAQQQYLRGAGVANNDIVLIPHFSRLAPQVQNDSDHRACFVALGRMVEKKGFHRLLEALGILHTQGSPADLLIGGAGPQFAELNKQVIDLGLEDNVKFAGWIESVSDFLKQGDIFVLPSLDEPFGIVVLEAMACGLPIISSRTDGPCEIFDEDSAYLVEIDNAEALAAAMQEALGDDRERRRRTDNAARLYRDKYTQAAVIPQYEALYRSLV